MNKTLLIIGGVVVVGAVAAYFVVNSMKKSKLPTDAEIQAMIDASNAAGWDTFEGMTVSSVKTALKNINKADVLRFTEIAVSEKGKKESEMPKSIVTEFTEIIQRMRG